MSAMPSTIEADFPAGSLPIRGPSTLNSGLEDDPFAGMGEHQPERIVRRKSSSLASLLIMFCFGVVATVAWYTFGGPVREALAGMSPQLAWMAPPPVTQPVTETSAVPTMDQ